jgi:hypothetical protein
VEVSDGELGAWDVHGEIHLGATGEVLDVAVSAVFGATLGELSGFDYWTGSLETYRDRASSFSGDFTLGSLVRTTCVCIQRLRRLRDDSISHCVGCDQFAFTLVPFSEYFSRGSTPQDAGVNETRETNVRDVTRGAKDALKVPNCLCSVVTIVSRNRFLQD